MKRYTLILLLAIFSLPIFGTAQTLHRAIQFDGTNDYIDCGTFSGVNLTAAATISLWVKFDALPSAVSHYMQLAAKPGAGQDLDLQVETDNKIKFFVAGGLNVVSTTTVQTGQWYHIAATYAGGSSVKLYVNGVLENTTNIFSSRTENTNHFAIGTNVYWPNRFLQGTIDEVRLYNRTLPQLEIQQAMCKTITGSETGLVGYWKLDEATDSTCIDQSGHNNTGVMKNMDPASDRILSSAPIGDESSCDYTGSVPSDFSVTLSHSDGDTFSAAGTGGTITGIQIYRADQTPMRTGATAPNAQWTLSNNRYWGVYCVGSSPACSITYNYQGAPAIITENDLGLATRLNYVIDHWADAGAVLSTSSHTLTTTSSAAEFSLGSKNGSNPLPVELTSFTASTKNSSVELKWSTATEVNNRGFEVERKALNNEQLTMNTWSRIGFVEGSGTSNAPKEYSFTDRTVSSGRHSYRLKQIDRNGAFVYSSEANAESAAEPNVFSLNQNYPNPFNPATMINYQLAMNNHVTVAVFDVLGKEVATLVNEMEQAGRYSVQFNAAGLAGGIYFCRLSTDAGSFMRTMILLK